MNEPSPIYALLGGVGGLIVVIFVIALVVLWIVLPFAVFRVRREIIETNRLLREIGAKLLDR